MTETKAAQEKPMNLHQRIAAVMAEVTYIQKEAKKGMNYTIVSHDAVTAKVRPILLKHGVIYYPTRCDHTHNGNRAECAMTVRFANIDNPEDCIDVPTFGYGVDTQDKGPGKAMSYAVKYALLKALGLETGDDADHDSVDHSTKDPAISDAELAAPHIAKIEAAETGKALLAILAEVGTANEIPEVAQARIDRIATLVKGAQSVAQIDQFAKAFLPDWSHIKEHADARKAELQQPAPQQSTADQLGDDIPEHMK